MAEYEMRWMVDGFGMDAWESDTHHFPTRTWVEAKGLRGAADVTVTFEMRDSVPEVVELVMKAKPDGRAIRSADLEPFLPLEKLAINAFRRFSRPKEGERKTIVGPGPASEREYWQLTKDLEDAQARRRGPSRQELEDVARIYRDAIEGRPTEAVQVQFGMSRRTAARRVQQARAAGLLPETTRGKKHA